MNGIGNREMVVKKALRGALMSLAAVSALPAIGSAQTFNTTGSMPDNGTYGNALYFSAVGKDDLKLKVTGWQSNQSTNAIYAAYVGAYGPGMGVTGYYDAKGAYGYHQIDNAYGLTDFVMLQFSAPVTLASVTLNSFTLGNATTKSNDFAVYAASIPKTAWNSAIDLSRYVTAPSLWTSFSGGGKDGAVATNMTTASSEWLVGAAFNSGGNDGFKIASINVAQAVPVPEPASWAMMIVGLGMVGFALRARRPQPALRRRAIG